MALYGPNDIDCYHKTFKKKKLDSKTKVVRTPLSGFHHLIKKAIPRPGAALFLNKETPSNSSTHNLSSKIFAESALQRRCLKGVWYHSILTSSHEGI